ncbi:MAG: substrate-binding domain-containing protein, partial [Paraburkholderia tropica]
GGRDAVRRLAAMAQRPTALICHTDLQAIGAMYECGVLGLRVPEDLSITGMDDIELAALMNPPLTTIRVPTKEIGVLAARRIVGMAEQRKFDDPATVACEIVLRESLGKAPARPAPSRKRAARKA